MAQAVCHSVSRAKDMLPSRVHTARQKNWPTQLNRAAYTKESLAEGIYPIIGGFKTQVTQTPETMC